LALIAHINLARGFRGGERQTEILVRELARGSWRQRLVARSREPLIGSLASVNGVQLAPVHNNALAAAHALSGADVVHVHEARALQAAYLHWLRSRRPYVVTRRVQKKPSNHWLNRAMYRRAARVVAVSRAIAESLEALDSRLQVTVIPDAASGFAVDPTRVASLRANWGGNFVVGHVGALVDSHKGQSQIIAVARMLRFAAPDLRFVLVGGGVDEAMLRTSADGLDNVHFTGQVADVGNYLAAFDVFIYPSRHEGLGSVLLDAMQFGLPVVATTVGGIPELVERGVNGLLCPPDDIPRLSAAITQLQADAGLRERMASSNRARARLFSPEHMTAGYVRIYEEILGSTSR
jgi:glycosyltransferase involved in cell wall biosynthesis